MVLHRRWSLSLSLVLGACGSEDSDPQPWGGLEDGGGSEGDGESAGEGEGEDEDEAGAEGGGSDAADGGMDDGMDDGVDDDGVGDGTGDGMDDGVDDGGSPGPAGSCGSAGVKGAITQVSIGSGLYFVGAPDTEEPLPMVVAFHGDEGHPDQAVEWFWTPVWQAEQNFILVMMKCPNCTSWYQGDTQAKAQYVWDVLEDVGDNHNVDVSRIYAIGYSGGSSFLAMHGLEFQSVFAGIQWHCGGGWTSYTQPPKPECKVDGRFVIATDDFLWDNAKAMEEILVTNGHEVEFIEAQCSGHCCHTNDLAEGAWAWFQQRTKCDGIVPGECAALTDVP